MSINLKLEIPLEAVMAILEAEQTHGMGGAMQVAAVKASKAVVDAIKSLPCDIKPKAKAAKTAATKPHLIDVVVKTLTGKTFLVNGIMSNARASELANRIEDTEGIPPNQQCLIHAGKQLLARLGEDDATDMSLDQTAVKHGSEIHLLLTLRGS